MAEFHPRKPDAYDVFVAWLLLFLDCGAARSLFGQQRHGLWMRLPILEYLDALLPCILLAVIDLAKVKHVALEHPAPGHALVLHDAPVAMLFPVFLPCAAAQEHDGGRLWRFFAAWE